MRGAGGEGMNAEEFHSDRDDANNTQFEPGKLIPKSTNLHK